MIEGRIEPQLAYATDHTALRAFLFAAGAAGSWHPVSAAGPAHFQQKQAKPRK